MLVSPPACLVRWIEVLMCHVEDTFYGAVAEWSKASNSGPMVVSSKPRSDISVEVTSQC